VIGKVHTVSVYVLYNNIAFKALEVYTLGTDDKEVSFIDRNGVIYPAVIVKEIDAKTMRTNYSHFLI
jgi:hypothetical protein